MSNHDLPPDLRDKADPHKDEGGTVVCYFDEVLDAPLGKCPKCGKMWPTFPIAVCPMDAAELL